MNVDGALRHLSVLGLCGPSSDVLREHTYSLRNRAEERERSWTVALSSYSAYGDHGTTVTWTWQW